MAQTTRDGQNPGVGDDLDGTVRMDPAQLASDSQPIAKPSDPEGEDDLERLALQLAGTDGQDPRAVATMAMPTVEVPAPAAPQPVVIKGGPRRVVRADGRAPKLGTPAGHRRFFLSSGNKLFVPHKRMPRALAVVIGILAIILVIAGVTAAWMWSNANSLRHAQEQVVGTASYNGSLSLTPAVDGGYYTVVMVASPVDHAQIGPLSDILMYRTAERPDKAPYTGAVCAQVPTNLAVSSTNAQGVSSTSSIADVLSNTGVSRALAGIDSSFDLRLYNVIVVDADTYPVLSGLLDGTTSADSVDASSLLGHVRSNMSLQGVVDYAAKVGAAAGTSIVTFQAPTSDVVGAAGENLVAGSPAQFQVALSNALAGKSSSALLDENGYPVGTAYDEAGNPILDANGYPQGTLYAEDGVTPLYNEDGSVVVYGQQYDENGNPIGTAYDENGYPIFDDNGNPAGTQYNEDGTPQIDWRGNMVIAS